jgi:FkbM family methyltransferase
LEIGGRDLSKIVRAPLQRRHGVAIANMFRRYAAPGAMLRRYLVAGGAYPYTVRIRTPTTWVELELHSPHDTLTVNEIFCRDDYKADADDKVVVDFGSNIGVSAAYFLSRGPDVYAYLFEPLPSNLEKLRHNLRRFAGRYELQAAAVGPDAGEVQFGWEETGRYGGIGVSTGKSITVACLSSREVIADVISRHGHIDVLKVDIEGLENAVVTDLPASLVSRIRKIYVEFVYDSNPLAATHDYRQYGDIAQFTLRSS